MLNQFSSDDEIEAQTRLGPGGVEATADVKIAEPPLGFLYSKV
jgi:hypothetical protein